MKNVRLLIPFALIAFSLSAQDSTYYSVQTHFGQFYRGDMDSTSMEAMLDTIQNAGITMIRDECYWSEVEKSKGVYTYPPEIDRYINAARRRGINVLLILDYNNPLYAAHAGAAVTDSANRAAYAAYCVETVRRYSPLGVKHYEIWNEPNNPLFWAPEPNAADYTALLKVAYPAIKQADSTVNVIAGSTSPLEGDPAPAIRWTTFLQGIVDAGGLASMDAVSIHLYRVDRNPSSWMDADYATAQSIVGLSKPIWITETGYPTSTVWPNVSLENQAVYVAVMYLMGRKLPEIKNITYYDLKNDGTASNNNEHNFGLLNFDLSPKPAFIALKKAIEFTDEYPFMSGSAMNNNFMYEFGSTSPQTIVVWNPSTAGSVSANLGGHTYVFRDIFGTARQWYVGWQTANLPTQKIPHYALLTEEIPSLRTFELSHREVVLDTTQQLLLKVDAADTNSLPVNLAPTAVTWLAVGDGISVQGDGTVRALAVSAASVIAQFGGKSDTALVRIVPRAGSTVVHDFERLKPWTLAAQNIDTASSALTFSAGEGEGESGAGTLMYRFTYKNTISSILYRALLDCNMSLPGEPDSLLISVYGNGQPNKLIFEVEDAAGKKLSSPALDQPTTWTNEWRTVKVRLAWTGVTLTYPLTLKRISVITNATVMKNDSTYDGTLKFDNLRTVQNNLIVTVDEPATLPKLLRLEGNYPNPFNPVTRIVFTIPEQLAGCEAEIEIFDALGRKVAEPFHSLNATAGRHEVEFVASTLPSGVYMYRLRANGGTDLRRMILLK